MISLDALWSAFDNLQHQFAELQAQVDLLAKAVAEIQKKEVNKSGN